MAADTPLVRCAWCGADPLYQAYHDTEWGVPLHDDRALFELLTLEGAQAGLSWLTVLKKREGYRKAFANFDPAVVARFTDADQARLLADPGIVRSRAKIEATIGNARAYLAIREGEGFDAWLWRYVDGRPLQNRFAAPAEVPAATPLSETVSKDLKKAGFRFAGPTIVYAFMQAVGMVNDHLVTCPAHASCAAAA